MREASLKEGIPAIHSKLPDGPNVEYDDGGPYLQELVFRAEYDFGESRFSSRTESQLDWSSLHLRIFAPHYRNLDGVRPDGEDEVLTHKRNGE